MKDGETAEGIMHGVDYKSGSLMLSNYYRHSDGPLEVQKFKKIALKDVKHFVVKKLTKLKKRAPKINNMKKKKFVKHTFETDREISKPQRPKKKQFVKWERERIVKGSNDDLFDFNLNDLKNKPAFDQMKYNETTFGLVDDFDESEYTTKINHKKYSKEQMKYVDKKFEEINKSELKGELLNNRHMREERGIQSLRDNEDEDEEALYSAVVRVKKESHSIPVKQKKSKEVEFIFKKVKENEKVKLKNRFTQFCFELWSKEHGKNKKKAQKITKVNSNLAKDYLKNHQNHQKHYQKTNKNSDPNKMYNPQLSGNNFNYMQNPGFDSSVAYQFYNQQQMMLNMMMGNMMNNQGRPNMQMQGGYPKQQGFGNSGGFPNMRYQGNNNQQIEGNKMFNNYPNNNGTDTNRNYQKQNYYGNKGGYNGNGMYGRKDN